jgi:hypothetical protein
VSGTKCSLGIHYGGASLVVAVQMPDIGQNVLQSSFATGNSSPNYCHILFRIAFLEEAFFFRNYTMNNVIIKHIDVDNATIIIRLDVKTLYVTLQNSRGNGKYYL